MLISLNDFCRELMLLKGPAYTLYFFSLIFLILASLIFVSLMILSTSNDAVLRAGAGMHQIGFVKEVPVKFVFL